jgi:hypothetical protein
MKNFSKILNLEENDYLIISPQDLGNLLSEFNLISETDTILSDNIRILEHKDLIFVQETSNKQEIIIRRLKDESAAKDLINQRLDIYEKMWDGCGCKVDYYK